MVYKVKFKEVQAHVPFNVEGSATHQYYYNLTRSNHEKKPEDRANTERKMHTLIDKREYMNLDKQTKAQLVQSACYDCQVMIKNNVDHHSETIRMSILMCLECTTYHHRGGGMYTVCKTCYGLNQTEGDSIHERYFRLKLLTAKGIPFEPKRKIESSETQPNKKPNNAVIEDNEASEEEDEEEQDEKGGVEEEDDDDQEEDEEDEDEAVDVEEDDESS